MLEANVIADDISLLAMMFGSCSFSYDYKSVNRFCSLLACMPYRGRIMQSWKSNLPLGMLTTRTEDKESFDPL